MLADDNYHEIISASIHKRDSLTGKNVTSCTIVRMTFEEIKSIYDRKFALINIYNIAARDAGNNNKLKRLNFELTEGLTYVCVMLSANKVRKKICISQQKNLWLGYIRRYTKPSFNIELIYFIKYLGGKLIKWDFTDSVLNNGRWRKFYRDIICADYNVDPFNPDLCKFNKASTRFTNAIIPTQHLPPIVDDNSSDDNTERENIE